MNFKVCSKYEIELMGIDCRQENLLDTYVDKCKVVNKL